MTEIDSTMWGAENSARVITQTKNHGFNTSGI